MNWSATLWIVAGLIVLYLFFGKNLRGRWKERKRRRLQEDLDRARMLGDEDGMAKCLYKLGILAHKQRQLNNAGNLYKQSLDIARKLNYQDGIASCLHQLGRLAKDKGDIKEAIRLFQQALEILNSLRSLGAKIAKQSLEQAMKIQGRA